MSDKIRILIADDHPLLTAGLKLTISGWDEFEVVGIAYDGMQAIELCDKMRPDIVIMDMRMPKLSGNEAIEQIKSGIPGVRILALTTFDDEETVSHALAAGCDGFLLKVIDSDRLKASLLSIAGGINVYDEDVMSRLRKSIKSKSDLEFNEREQEILRLVCEGKTNIEIAEKLGLRAGTVKNLISLLLSKSNCISRSQLARYATENFLI